MVHSHLDHFQRGALLSVAALITSALVGTSTGGAHPVLGVVAVVGLVVTATAMGSLVPRQRNLMVGLFVVVALGGLWVALLGTWESGLQGAYYGVMAMLLLTGVILIRTQGTRRREEHEAL